MLLINDLGRHTATVREAVDAAVSRVLARGWYVLGPEVDAFETEFAAYCGVTHCVGVANGTDALELALRAAGATAGDRIATVANAGMYSTAAILALNATPVFVEIDSETGLMDPEALAKVVPVAAVVATHLYGRMAPMPALLDAAEGVPVIEDCAQAHGAELDGRRAGSWGVAGCFSFYPTKNLGALGDGGAVVTNSAPIADRLRALRQYGWRGKYLAMEPFGRNSRLDEMQAAVLRAKLPELDGWNARRRQIAAGYSLPGEEREGPADVVHLYILRHPRRDALRNALRAQGIAAEIHYPIPDYRQEAVAQRIGSVPPLPLTEQFCHEVLTLPCFPEMTDEEVRTVRETVIDSVESL